MCCRLQLDLRELLKRGNGLFGSAEQTGSVGVVTINCARLGYTHRGDEAGLFKRLDALLDIARTSLEIKRKEIQRRMEALLRWEHPVYGLIPPPLTVALAEDLGCIDRLGLFVLREACAQRAAWKGLVPDGLTVSVNVSPRQFADALFGQKVLGVLAASGLDATTLVVEITEGSVLEPDARTVATLRWLREMGVRVAIDDFGMGMVERFVAESPDFAAGEPVVITAGRPTPGNDTPGTNEIKIFYK